jgi:hypothetical protein
VLNISNEIEILELESGVRITLCDETRHYFGGYYHVKVLAHCDVSLDRSFFDDEPQYLDAMEKLGKSVRFERALEKMAVPAQDIESVRNQLVADFKQTTLSYLAAPDFECRLVRSEYRLILSKSANKFSYRAS